MKLLRWNSGKLLIWSTSTKWVRSNFERKKVNSNLKKSALGHTYFGDLLVISHFDHAWLKESWATYIEACKSLQELYNRTDH